MKGLTWMIGLGALLAVAGGVLALTSQRSELEACRSTCFDAYARCSGANAIQCTVVRGDCEAKCTEATATDDPAIAAHP